jgi:hypothetical protein
MNEDDDAESGSDESSSSDQFCEKKAQTKKRAEDIEDARNDTNERIGRKRKRRS